MNDREDDSPLERRLRELLNERAERVAPSEAPLEAIARKGRVARQRSRVALGAGLAVLVAVPGFAIAAQGSGSGGSGADTAVQPAGPSAPAGPETPQESGESPPDPEQEVGPLPPSDPQRQLLDGITLEQAAAILERCVEEAYADQPDPYVVQTPIVNPSIEDLRIVLAWESQGNENQGPGPWLRVLAVTDDPSADYHHQMTCTADPDGNFSGVQGSAGAPPEREQVVLPDSNASRHYAGDEWTTPFRWAHYGEISPEVARLTVTYAGATEEAALESGYFAVAGIAEQSPDGEPVIKAYDEGGELIHDSRTDSVFP
ncbi:hypothetical protein H7827_10445 [Streptomyces sp. JH002]|uniref:hypothetical protein n=1 Tax=Streptomyces sp. JH002 TaxID=2763259 RepID=UPI003D8026DD